MSSRLRVLALHENPNRSSLGTKAESLWRLRHMGYAIPVTYVIPWEWSLCADDETTTARLRHELGQRVSPTQNYAVRSSANVEDGFETSYAGQFQSYLNVRGIDALITAIEQVWASLDSDEVREYRQRHGVDPDSLRMSVIVQEMVEPVFSGVAFNRNPLTGVRETVVEAVEGLGTALLQEGVTPWRWVYHYRDFIAVPKESTISLTLIGQVVADTRAIAQQARMDVDLEWVWDGSRLYWVQLRRITTLGEVHLYSNRLARELLPGQILPLVWSVSVPLTNGQWIALLTEIIGPNQLTPDALARSFHYCAYFNMGLLGDIFESIGFPAESLEIMWGLAPRGKSKVSFRPSRQAIRLLPRLLRFAWHKWRIAPRLEQELVRLEQCFRSVNLATLTTLTPEELLRGLDQHYILMEQAVYYNIVAPVLCLIYNHLLRSRLQRLGVDFAQLDLGRNTQDFQRFDPTQPLSALHQLYQGLDPTARAHLDEFPLGKLTNDEELTGFMSEVFRFLDEFGQLSDSGNDFSSRPWRENVPWVLELIRDHRASNAPDSSRLQWDELPARGVERWWLTVLYHRARQFSLYREHISYIYTLGNSLFRPYYLTLARHLQEKGSLAGPEDIFYLTAGEVRQASQEEGDPVQWSAMVDQRRGQMEAVRDITLPEVIYGDEPPPLRTGAVHQLTGTATSRGYAQGRARLVRGFQDFSKVNPGDILVIPYSDVSWTPLFTRASGVVSESGGILSHSSIVAREYGIPAVVSVIGAMQLPDDCLIHVDGYTGEVSVIAE